MRTTIIFFLLGAFNCFSQEPSATAGKLYGGFGHFSFSGQSFNIGGMNALLKQNSYGEIDPFQYSWGGGGNFVIGNWMLGGEGAGIFNSSASNADNSINFSGGYGFFNLGYLFRPAKRWLLYPALGLGAGGYDLTISSKSANRNFQDQITSPSGYVTMQSGGLLLNAQLGWQYFFCGKHTSGFFIGAKTGYRYTPAPWNFSLSGERISDGPAVNMDGFYFTLVLGGGSVNKSVAKVSE
jgi:hypothetical protein